MRHRSTVVPRAARIAAALLAIACGEYGEPAALPTGPVVEPVVRTQLAVGMPVRDSVGREGARYYSAPVTPGVTYVVSLTGLTDSAAVLRVHNGGAVQGPVQAGVPKDVRVTAAGTRIDVDVDGLPVVKAHAAYHVSVLPAPVVSGAVSGSSGLVPLGTPTVGWVEARGRSRYRLEGAGAGRTISIVGLTGAAELHVYPDSTYTMELECTLRNFGSRECAAPGMVVYFEVVAGGVNRDGAGYVMLGW